MTGIRSTSQTAVDALTTALAQPLYRIDLSRVVSKYIGQTEKNLRAVFDDAEDSDAILLFDEGDTLFGRHSEDDIGIGYLLGRIHGRARRLDPAGRIRRNGQEARDTIRLRDRPRIRRRRPSIDTSHGLKALYHFDAPSLTISYECESATQTKAV